MSFFGNPPPPPPTNNNNSSSSTTAPPPWRPNTQPMAGQATANAQPPLTSSLPVFGSVAGTNAASNIASGSGGGGGILGKPGLLPSAASFGMSFGTARNTGILPTVTTATAPGNSNSNPPLFARSVTSNAPPAVLQPTGNMSSAAPSSLSPRPAFAFAAGQPGTTNVSALRFGTQPQPFFAPGAATATVNVAAPRPASRPLSFAAPSFVPSNTPAMPAALSPPPPPPSPEHSISNSTTVGFGNAKASREGASVFGSLAPSSFAPASSAFGSALGSTGAHPATAGKAEAVHSAFAPASTSAQSGVLGGGGGGGRNVTWPSAASTTAFAAPAATHGAEANKSAVQQSSNNNSERRGGASRRHERGGKRAGAGTSAEQSSFAAQLQRRESRFASSFAAAKDEVQQQQQQQHGPMSIPAPRSSQQAHDGSNPVREKEGSAVHSPPAAYSPAPFSPIASSTATVFGSTASHSAASTALDTTHVGGGELCPLARVFAVFLRHLAQPGSRAQASAELELALDGLAGRIGLYADFRRTTAELLRVWQESRRGSAHASGSHGAESLQKVRGEMWVLVFALGAQINLIVHAAAHGAQGLAGAQAARPETQRLAAYMSGVQAHREAALADACGYANRLSQLTLELYQHEEDTLAPYTALPPLLQRVRTAFEAASAHGVVRVASNLKAITAKLFSLLNKRVKTTVVQFAEGAPSSAAWMLTCHNASERQLVFAFAHLVGEMSMAEAPSNEEVEQFMGAFHRAFPHALPERCKLYFCKANLLLGQALTLRQLRLAAELFAKALVTCPDQSPHGNRRLFFLKLTATQLALGAMPRSSDDLARYAIPQLADMVVAVRTASLPLFDLAMRHNAVFYVQTGIHNVLQMVRQRIALLMVVKFYLACGCQSRLSVTELVAHYALPYSEMEAMTIWLLPLLVEKYINGVLDGLSLVLSDANPFDDYDKATLLRVAAEEYPADAATSANEVCNEA